MSQWHRLGVPTTIPDGMDDIPELHTVRVRDRRIEIDYPTLIQNNVKTDQVTLDLDGEWDGLSVLINLGDCPNPVSLVWTGSPVTIPAAVMSEVGGVDVSVVGTSADGETRLVTAAADNAFTVIKSGCDSEGDVPEDPTSVLGQLIQAAEDAEEAAESANQAATSANSAASSASTAATAANSAASSAASAASSANSAANAANAAAQHAIQAADNLTGNVLTGSVDEAGVASGSDAWGQAPLQLEVFGNTRQNLWVNPATETRNGVTLTANADGSITVSGTSTASVNTYFNVSHNIYTLKPETTYTLSVDKAFTGMYATVREDDSSGSIITGHIVYSGAITFQTKANMASCFLYVSVVAGSTVSGTYRVMLNEGSEALPWCPPGIHSVGELMEHERNLWVNPNTQTASGVTFTANADGSVDVVGKPTVAYVIASKTIDIGELGVSVGDTIVLTNHGGVGSASYSTGAVYAQISFTDQGGSTIGNAYFTAYAGLSRAVSVPSGADAIKMEINCGTDLTTERNATIRIMLNKGDTAMPWVPPACESAVQVVTAGKNLAGAEWKNEIFDGASGAIVSDPQNKYAMSEAVPVIPCSTLSFGVSEGYRACLGYWKTDGAYAGFSGWKTIATSLAVPGDVAWIRFAYSTTEPLQANITLDIETVQPMMNYGSVLEEYETPKPVVTTPVPLSGHTLAKLPDGTRDVLTVGADGSAAVDQGVAAIMIPADTEDVSWDGDNNRIYFETEYECARPSNDNYSTIVVCDRLPSMVSSADVGTASYCNVGGRLGKTARAAVLGSTSAADTVSKVGGGEIVYTLASMQQIDLSAVTLPALPPTWNMWIQPNANGVPAALAVDYARDVTKVIGGLEARVAALEDASQ